MRRKLVLITMMGTLMAAVPLGVDTTLAGAGVTSPAQPAFGPNVVIFDPGMPTSQIQATVDAIAGQQVSNQFGSQRYALLFKPGTYGSSYRTTELPGRLLHHRGRSRPLPDRRRHQRIHLCAQPVRRAGNCIALNNFWRSLSNLTINVTTPNFGCYTGEFWAVSQAAPMRRVNVTGGNVTLMDYCTGPSFASGGFIADSAVRRRHGHQRLAAAVARPEQRPRRLEQRRLEPGVLRRRRCACPVLPGSGIVRRPVHDACDQPGDARGALPVRGRRTGATRSSSRRCSATPPARHGATGRRPAPRSRSTSSSSPSRPTARSGSTTRSPAART